MSSSLFEVRFEGNWQLRNLAANVRVVRSASSGKSLEPVPGCLGAGPDKGAINYKRADRFLAAVLILLLLRLWSSSEAATITWVNTSGGNWTTAANWSPAQVPGPADSVTIAASGSYTVTNTATVQVSSLVLGGAGGIQTLTINNGGTLSVSNGFTIETSGVLNLNSSTLTGSLNVSGTFNMTAATIGARSAVTIQSTGVMNLGGNNSSSLYGALTNAGTVNWSASNDLYVFNSPSPGYIGQIVNQAGAIFNLQNDRSIFNQSGTPYFINAGSLQKSAGTNSTMNLTFTNTGTLNLASGSLTLNAGGSSSGSITGPGSVIVGGNGTLVLSGVVPNLNILGAAVNAQSLSISNLTWSNGTLQGDNTLTGVASWAGGSLAGGSSLTIGSNAVLNINGNSSVSLSGRLLNLGTVNWSSRSEIYVYNAASVGTTGRIVNQPGALFDIQTDHSIMSEQGSPDFSNAGTLQKSVGTNSTINLLFTNTGTLNLASGSLTLNGGGASSGTVQGPGSVISAGGTLVLSGTVPNLNLVGGTVNGQGLSISNLTFNNGTLQGNTTVTGLANWIGGSTGSGSSLTIAPNALLNISGNSSVSLYGMLMNSGTVNWSSAGDIYVYNAASVGFTGGIINQAGGIFNAQSDRTLNSASGSPFFINAGTLQKSAGTNTTINMTFTNTGTLNVATGNVVLNAGGSSTGTITGSGTVTVSGSGTFVLSGTVPNLNISGASFNGQNATIGNLTWTGGSLQGTETVTGVASWAGGNLAGGSTWTIAPSAVLNITGNFSTSIYGMLVNSGTVNWSATGDLYVYNAASAGFTGGIVNQAGGIFNVQNDRSITSGSGSPSFINAGTFQKSAGTNTTINLAFTNTGTISLGIYDRTHYGSINFPGNTVLGGSLAVHFNSYSPYAGDSFALVSYGSENGTFSSVNVPIAGPWQTNIITYSPTVLTLTIGSFYNLGFASGPAGTNSAGLPFSPVVVQVQHSDGTPLATNGVPVTIAMTGGTGSLGGTVTQTTDASGKATFSDLTVNLVGQKTVTASSAAWITPVSTNLTIVPGPPAQLRLLSPITVSPQRNGYPIVPGPVVQVLDAPGNVVSNATTTISINSTSTGGGSLGGVTTGVANGTNGTAAFNNFYYALKDPTKAETVTIYFSSPGLTPATNSPIKVEFVCGLITLADGNSVVQIDPNTSNGMLAWTVDGTDQLSQHWFWLQAGTNNTQVSIDQFGTPLGLLLTASTVSFNYLQTGLIATLSFTLSGGAPGSHLSTLTESVSIQNTSNNSATWHFYDYTDFDLAGDTDGDTISFPGTNVVVQQGKGATATQVLGGPAPNFWEASWYALTLDTLQTPTHAVLSDKINQPMPGDQSFAYQWDLSVAAGQSFTLNLTNSVLAQAQGLSIALSGANALLSWSTNASASLKLQSNDNLVSGSAWGDVAAPPVIVGGNYQVTIPLTNNAQFFRLH